MRSVVGQCVLIVMAAPQRTSLESLTRRHGIRVMPAERCSVEDCVLAVADVIGHDCILSASRMNSAIVMFLSNIDKVNKVVETGITVNDSLTPVMPLVQPAKRIVLSNVPPFIKDEAIERELSRHGKFVSKIRKMSLSCKLPQLKHVVSFRRQVHMILNNQNEELNLSMKFRIEDFDYVIFVTSESMKCFICGQEGHVIRTCPEKSADQNRDAGEVLVNTDQAQTSDKIPCVDKDGPGDCGNNKNESVPRATNEGMHEGGVSEVSEQAILGDALVVDMLEDQSLFKTPTLKRKTKGKGKDRRVSKKATGIAAGDARELDSELSNVEESAVDSDCESSDSVSSASQKRSVRSAYTLDKIKKFLQTTKGMKDVVAEDYFPDRELFINSARALMKDDGAFTEQEVFRLKKIVQKLKLNLLNDEFESV